jgi:hypothetical protein
MRAARPGALLLGALLAATLEAQRSFLPYGLRAGRRDVGVRVLANPGRPVTVWYPAACGRPQPVPTSPCADAPPDSGRFPLLLLASAGRPLDDTARAVYFASHAYGVVLVEDGRMQDAWRAVHALAFVDSTQIVAFGTGGDLPAPARARVIVAPDGGLTLSEDSLRLTVTLPPGPSSHFRLVTSVSHAFLDAALGRGPSKISDLTRSLKRSRLVN